MKIIDDYHENTNVLLRTLTRKSIIGFGYNNIRNLSIQQLLDSGEAFKLISSYFGLAKITFTDDILDELCILPEERIAKPGKLSEYWEIRKVVYERYKEKHSKLLMGISQTRKKHLNKLKESRTNLAISSRAHNRIVSVKKNQ